FIVYQTIFGESFPEPGTDNGLRPVDLNSDGLVDLVYGGPDGTRQAWRNTGSSTNRWQSWTGYVPPVGFSAKRATLTGWPVNPPQGFEDKAYDTTAWLADFTGDGLPDLLYKSVPHIQISGTNQELIRYR